MPKKPMTSDDASRIQSASDKTGRNPDFKERAQSAGDKNAHTNNTHTNNTKTNTKAPKR